MRAELRERILAHNRAVAQLRGERDSLQARFERLRDSQWWAAINSNTLIPAGQEVYYLGAYYVCVQEHNKSLLRGPANEEYWRRAEQQ